MSYSTSITRMSAVAGLLAALAGPGTSQPQSVVVDLRYIAAELARELGASQGRLPPTVQLSAADAAYVCGIDLTAITPTQPGEARRCAATTASDELRRAVRQVLGPPPAQQPQAYQPGTVRGYETPQQSEPVQVDIAPIRDHIAVDLGVEPGQVPYRVRAPVHVAADACGVARNVLEYQRSTGLASCTAQATTPALNRIVRPRLTLADGSPAR